MAYRTSVIMIALFVLAAMSCALAEDSKATQGEVVQAQAILTVSEGKRLIAKAVAQMPPVKKALQDGMIIIGRGTTNTYVAEELTGRKIAHGSYVVGWTGPAKGGKTLDSSKRAGDIILIKGKEQPDLSMDDALKDLKRDDVVIKGANALDVDHKLAGILIAGGPSSSAGTTGKIVPVIVARKAHLIIPVGLEKQVAGSIVDIANKMREPMESLNDIPSMFLVNGEIVTEIEALQLLTTVHVFQAAAGGVGGAEGGSRLILRGPRQQVQQALTLVESIQGEPPFLE